MCESQLQQGGQEACLDSCKCHLIRVSPCVSTWIKNKNQAHNLISLLDKYMLVTI